MVRWFASLAFALALLTFGGARAQGDILFEESFDSSRTALVYFDAEDYYEPELITGEGDPFSRLIVPEALWIEPETLEIWGDYRLELTTRIQNGTLYITGRSGSGSSCEGYDLVFTSESEIFFSSVDADCEYLRDFGDYSDPVLDPGEWVTFAMEFVGESLSVFVNGEQVISGEDDTYSEGDLLLYFEAEGSKGGTLDLADLRVTALGETASAGGGRTVETTSNADARVVDFAGAPEDVMAELAAQDLVESGGYVLFREDYAWFEGTGSWFTPLARQQSRQNVVMGGELTFTYGESDEFQACGLMTRVNTDANGSTTTQTEFGVTSFGETYVFDADFRDDLFDAYYEPVRFTSGDSAHVLMVLQGGLATLFVDGERLMDRVKIETRSGSFGIGLLSTTPEARCEGREIWVWTWE